SQEQRRPHCRVDSCLRDPSEPSFQSPGLHPPAGTAGRAQRVSTTPNRRHRHRRLTPGSRRVNTEQPSPVAAYRGFDRSQPRLDLSSPWLQEWRERQPLAQAFERFVGSESRTVGRDLEEHASRLPEVNGREVEAIDNWRYL